MGIYSKEDKDSRYNRDRFPWWTKDFEGNIVDWNDNLLFKHSPICADRPEGKAIFHSECSSCNYKGYCVYTTLNKLGESHENLIDLRITKDKIIKEESQRFKSELEDKYKKELGELQILQNRLQEQEDISEMRDQQLSSTAISEYYSKKENKELKMRLAFAHHNLKREGNLLKQSLESNGKISQDWVLFKEEISNTLQQIPKQVVHTESTDTDEDTYLIKSNIGNPETWKHQRYDQHHEGCGHKWRSYVEHPRKCPKCFQVLPTFIFGT